MSLLQDIKKQQVEARKTRDTIKASILTTLIGEAEMVGKNNGNRETTDSEAIATIKKFINNSNLTLETISKLFLEDQKDFTSSIEKITAEKKILESFLPRQYTGTELSSIINSAVTITGATTIKDMGKVMKFLKESYDGQFDGKEASTLIKTQLGIN